VEEVNLTAAGIKPGDWYVIYAVRPGLRVCVANDAAWRREPATGWQQFSLRATGSVAVTAPALARGCNYQAAGQPWAEVPAGTALAISASDHGATQVLVGRPAWLALDDTTGPQVTELRLDGQPLAPDKAADLGWIEPPKQLRLALRDAENPLAEASLQVTLNGKPLPAAVAGTAFSPDRRAVTIDLDLDQAAAGERRPCCRQTLTVAVSDLAVTPHETRLRLSYLPKVPLDPAAVYLSDLKWLKAVAHGGPNRDRDYGGDIASIGDCLYPKCLMLCPESSPAGAQGEVIFALPAGKARVLHSDVGIEDGARGQGSAVFIVQRGSSAEGPWETLFTSPTLRGGAAALTLRVDLGEARFLRLCTTDAGDGIHSDHALWGNARLLPAP